MRNQRKELKIVHGHLNKITNTCKSIANEWGMEAIPLTTLRTVIDKSKIESNEDNTKIHTFIKRYNYTLDVLFTTCENVAKRMGSKNVPIEYLRQCITLIKKSMAEPVTN